MMNFMKLFHTAMLLCLCAAGPLPQLRIQGTHGGWSTSTKDSRHTQRLVYLN